MTQIDYSKLNDRIVRQATEFTLSEEEKQQLFKNKISRVAEALELRKTNPVYHQIED